MSQRPIQLLHEPGPEMRTITKDRVQRWRQYGWIGQSGALYALHEDPSKTEPGSFSPLWMLDENEDQDERDVDRWLAS